ncbi:MAG: hypothetical protein GY951_03480 [Psychromonas sp.]|nr:hypothetical protein [Alteromonadales bacterium]MCP5077101.1 hypothetical protein [Psychromonas sp.]
MNILQHHTSGRFRTNIEQRNSRLLANINEHFLQELPTLWNEEKIQHAAPHLMADYLRYFTDAIMLGWPKAHCIWLLSHAAEMGWMHFRMLQDTEILTPITLAGKELYLVPKASNSWNDADTWLDACLANAILGGQQAAIDEICNYKTGMSSSQIQGQDNISPHDAMFNVYEHYVMNDLSAKEQLQALQLALQFSEQGKVAEVYDIEREHAIQFIAIPQISLIASCWQRQEATVSLTAKYAIEAHLDYYADIMPEPGEPRGKDSIDLFDQSAMLMRDLLGFLALHYQRTGESPDFESPYIPSWLIKGEFPSREEVLFNNPPVFDLKSVAS